MGTSNDLPNKYNSTNSASNPYRYNVDLSISQHITNNSKMGDMEIRFCGDDLYKSGSTGLSTPSYDYSNRFGTFFDDGNQYGLVRIILYTMTNTNANTITAYASAFFY